MEILIGLALGVVLLYFWLVGHWFARVLVFLALAPCLGGALSTAASANPGSGVILFALGVGAAWLIASLPIYWRGTALTQKQRDIRRAMHLLRPDWTPGQIEGYCRDVYDH